MHGWCKAPMTRKSHSGEYLMNHMPLSHRDEPATPQVRAMPAMASHFLGYGYAFVF